MSEIIGASNSIFLDIPFFTFNEKWCLPLYVIWLTVSLINNRGATLVYRTLLFSWTTLFF
jgi:hypothetical protein